MLGYQIVFIGAPSDKVRIEQIQKLAGGIGVCLAGATSINQAAALIALSDLVVSINTGTAHVTRSVGTPAVILDIAWQKPLEWMVTDQAHIRLLRGPDQERAPDYCMEELTVEHVTAALTEMIELFPADEAAREARLAASLSDVELLRR
jgi:heptosyltransferase-2